MYGTLIGQCYITLVGQWYTSAIHLGRLFLQYLWEVDVANPSNMGNFLCFNFCNENSVLEFCLLNWSTVMLFLPCFSSHCLPFEDDFVNFVLVLIQAKWYYYILLGLVDVEANFLGK